jgi:type I restriction enzyme S subunit
MRDALVKTEEFKDSPLEKIPEDWEVKSLAEISRQITDGVHATPNYTSAGIPFISVNNLVGNCISFDSCQFISEAEHEILIQRCHPEQGDILLGKVATLGVVGVVVTDRKFSIFVQVALVKLKAGLIPKFIKYSITHKYLQDQIQQKASGTTIRYIGVEMIGKLLVKVPSKKEQESIAAILDTHDTRIRAEEAYRNKLKLQKQGLMHDLLTGKVRVNEGKEWKIDQLETSKLKNA